MAGETTLAIVGNLAADPELRTTQSGKQVCNVTVASTPRIFDRQTNQWTDGQALFLRCTAWGDFATHIASSMPKGMRVIAQGRLTQRSWQDEQGANHTVIEMQLDEIGPSLRYATAQVTRITRQQVHQPPTPGGYTGGASFGATAPTAGPQAPATDPWGQPTDGGATFGSFGTPGSEAEKEPEF